MYETHADNTGRAATFEEIFYYGFEPSLKTICQLRRLDKSATGYEQRKRELKNKLQCYTPAALLQSKSKDNLKVISRTNVMQFDFDYKDIKQYNIEELKQAVFSLPFIGYCGLSCSGDGFYALALIAEPERLYEYAEHCFIVFEKEYKIKVDTSKGKKLENLRYVTRDDKQLVKHNPQPLQIKKFHTTTSATIKPGIVYKTDCKTNDAFLLKQLNKLLSASPGNRMNTIKQLAFALGGKRNEQHLQALINTIYGNTLFADDTKAFIRCAEDCFRAGMQRPY